MLLGATLVVSVFGGNGLPGQTVIPVTSAFDSFLGINTAEPITEITVSGLRTRTLSYRGC